MASNECAQGARGVRWLRRLRGEGAIVARIAPHTNVRGFMSRGLGGPARSSSLRGFKRGVIPQQRAIEFGEEWAGLLRVWVEVVLYAESSLAPTSFRGWLGGVRPR